MELRKDQVVILDPEHEKSISDEDEITLNRESIRIKLLQEIKNIKDPFTTYWEIKYLDSTPNREKGYSVVITESLIDEYIIEDQFEGDQIDNKVTNTIFEN